MTQSTRLLLASTTSIVLSSVFVGANATLTYITLPTALLPPPSSPSSAKNEQPQQQQQPASSPTHLARQWALIYSIGSRVGPAIAAPSAAMFFYASRLSRPSPTVLGARNMFLAAAVCNMLIVPFTFLFMKRTNDELHRRAACGDEDSAKADSSGSTGTSNVENMETAALIHYWGNLNIRRASLHMMAIGLGIGALVV